jgi:hypothetical protein
VTVECGVAYGRLPPTASLLDDSGGFNELLKSVLYIIFLFTTVFVPFTSHRLLAINAARWQSATAEE